MESSKLKNYLTADTQPDVARASVYGSLNTKRFDAMDNVPTPPLDTLRRIMRKSRLSHSEQLAAVCSQLPSPHDMLSAPILTDFSNV